MSKYKDSWNFDVNQINYIKKLYNEGDITKAINLIEKYIRKYPKDMSALGFYIVLLIAGNRYGEALEYINYVSSKSNFDLSYKKYMLSFHMKDYETAYKLYPKISKYISDEGNNNFADYYAQGLYLRYKLGMKIKQKDINELRYKDRQLIVYSEEDAIKYIMDTHTKDGNYPYDLFEDSIDVKELFYQIKDLLPNASVNKSSWLLDIYYFQYPDIPDIIALDGTQFKYLKVIVARDTYNIITIEPRYSKRKYDTINRIESVKTNKAMVKRLSNIEKFNQKYGLK